MTGCDRNKTKFHTSSIWKCVFICDFIGQSPKALMLDTAKDRAVVLNMAPGSDVSAAVFRRFGVGTQDYPAAVGCSALALLLLLVLTQQSSHLLLVVERTGTEAGLQPCLVLVTQDDKKLQIKNIISSFRSLTFW